jgi:hypothetical protein
VFAQQENVVGKKDFARAIVVTQVLHFRDDSLVLADGHAVIADRAGVIAAESAMVRASARRQHRVMGVLGEIVKAPIHDRQIIQGRGLGVSGRPDDFSRRAAEKKAWQAAQVQSFGQTGHQFENDRLTFAQDNDIGPVSHEVVGKERRVDASGQDPEIRVQLLQPANLLSGHGVIRRNDREARHVGLKLGDKLKQTIVFQAFDVLVEDTNFVPVLLQDGAEEPHTQRVFTVHLLGIVGPWSDEQDSHQRTPSSLSWCKH